MQQTVGKKYEMLQMQDNMRGPMVLSLYMDARNTRFAHDIRKRCFTLDHQSSIGFSLCESKAKHLHMVLDSTFQG